MMSRSISTLTRNFPRIFALSSTSRAGSSRVFALQQNQQMRSIFTSQPRFCSPNLVAALEAEIKEEKALEQEKLGGSATPAIPGYKISIEGAKVRLSKMHGKEKIDVFVNVKHSVDIDQDFDEPEEQEPAAEGRAEEVTPVALPPFSISITKGNQSLWFELDMAKTEEATYDFTVSEFYIAPAKDGEPIAQDNEEMYEKLYASSGRYIDENMHDLLFVKYLEERGFTSEFCHQLVDFATHYEHKMYVELLEKIKKFVEK